MISDYITADVLTYVLFGTLGAVAFFMVASFFQRYLISYRELWRKRTLLGFKTWLKDAVENKRQFQKRNVPRKFRKVYYMVPVLEDLDQEYIGDQWDEWKEVVTKSFLLPKARWMRRSLRQNMRHWALRCFMLLPLKKDEKHVIKLLGDRADSVRIEAAQCAIAIETKQTIEALMNRLSKEPERLHFAYIDALLQGGASTINYLKSNIDKAKTAELKAVYIEVLSALEGEKIIPFAAQHVDDPARELRLAVAKAYAEHGPRKLTPEVEKLAQDSESRIRLYAMRSLIRSQSRQTVDVLTKGLDDDDVYVQLQAGYVLRKIGKQEVLKLHKQGNSRSVADYILALPDGVEP